MSDYEYDAHVIRVVDGDTVILRVCKETTVDFGFHVRETTTREYVGSFRLAGIDAPEGRGRDAQVEAAGASRTRLIELLSSATQIRATTKKDPDNFGRYLVHLTATMIDGSEVDVNQTLVTEGHAVPYVR